MKHETIQHRRNVHEVRYRCNRTDRIHMLLTSDWHYDNPHCNRELLHGHLDEAREKGALVCCFGDLFCFMQGKYDKRHDKSDVRPEHMSGEYLDVVIRDTAEKLRPWHNQLFVVGLGNHETAMRKAHETDVIDRFVQTVRYMTPSSPIQAGGYGGWLKVVLSRHASGKNGNARVIKYFHGSGGGGPVTKGAIQQQRHAVVYEGADIVYSGHIHEAQSTEFVKEKFIANTNTISLCTQEHLRGATYKEEYADGYAGWHIERGAAPKPLGGWWVDFFFGKGDKENAILHTAYRAKSLVGYNHGATRPDGPDMV